MKTTLSFFSLAVGTLLFSNCTPVPAPLPVQPQTPTYLQGYQTQPDRAEVGYWDGDGITGTPLIKINIDQQKAYFYKGNQLVGQTPISSGSENHKTPRGTYKVTEKDIDHTSSLYGVIKDNATGAVVNADADTRKHKAKAGQTFVHAPMLNFLRFNGAIGMHTGHLPGYPASHGCVRLPHHMASKFYEHAKYGTKVIVE